MARPRNDAGLDWACGKVDCPNHTNLVFASKDRCPVCGTPKSKSTGGGGLATLPQPRIPDWACPNTECQNHERMVFGKKETCPKCGSSRTHVVDGADDWQCPNVKCCNHTNFVFGKHKTCPSCCEPRPKKTALAQLSALSSSGEWNCPNPQCVYGKKVPANVPKCPKCGYKRNLEAIQEEAQAELNEYHASLYNQYGFMIWAMHQGKNDGGAELFQAYQGEVLKAQGIDITQLQQAVQGEDGQGAIQAIEGQAIEGQAIEGQGDQGVVQEAAAAMVQKGAAAPSEPQPAGWKCPNFDCINHTSLVSDLLDQCPTCGMMKPSGKRVPGPNDWQCPNPDCLNHKDYVIGLLAACELCGTAKPFSTGPTTSDTGLNLAATLSSPQAAMATRNAGLNMAATMSSAQAAAASSQSFKRSFTMKPGAFGPGGFQPRAAKRPRIEPGPILDPAKLPAAKVPGLHFAK